MDGRPGSDLIRITPNTEECTDILSQPKKESDEKKRKQQWHPSVLVQRPVHNRGARIQPERARRDVPAKVPDVMMSKKVGVDQYRYGRRHPIGRMVFDSQVK